MNEEFVVEYDWNPETGEELSLVQGETIIVLEKSPSGWWSGISTSSGAPKRGYFPMNYLRAKDASAPSAATSTSRKGIEFSIGSLDAFDSLVERGFAVEHVNRNETGAGISLGSRVTVIATVMTWDGATTEATVVSEGPLTFTAGAVQVPSGLDEAILSLKVGDEAAVICSPAKAFGYAGHPPLIPPNSHVVYSVKVQSIASIEPAAAALLPAEGDQNILASGVHPVRTTKAIADSNNRRSVVLDLSENKKAPDGGTEISDEMLARAAASMGMGASEN